MGEEEGFSDDIIYVYQTITSIVYIQSWKIHKFRAYLGRSEILFGVDKNILSFVFT